jgi:choline dehydrogenase
MSESFEYVIVGSGAGGGPLAANLAAAGHTVLVLEAGGAEEPWEYQVPAFHGLSTEHPDLRWDFFVRHYDDDERQRRDTKYVEERDGVLYPRAGTLGGCTAHNAMLTVYPHDRDWDDLAAITGDASFNSEAMRGRFERMERCDYVKRPWPMPSNPYLARLVTRIPWLSNLYANVTRHGWDGWLCTSLADPKLALRDQQLVDVVLSAARTTLSETLRRSLRLIEDLQPGSPKSFADPNDWRVRGAREGLWFAPLAMRNGGRVSTRDCLRAAQIEDPGKLTIRTGALACRVVFEGTRAVGVEYLAGRHLYRADPRADGAGEQPERVTVRAQREVVLAGGAFNTPQLLKLSGIGPAAELEQHGIPVLVDLPGVGENLQDRYEVGVISEMEKDFPLLRDAAFRPPRPGDPPDRAFDEWRTGKGAYASNGVVIGIVMKSSRAQPDPDLFVFGLPAWFEGYYPGYAERLTRDKHHFTWAILKAHTANRAGSVRLRSGDPRDVPSISFRYFDEGSQGYEDDLEAMADGVEFVRRLMRHSAEYMTREALPGDAVRTREQIKEWVRDQAWGHHASCTCRMGPPEDTMAVVDSRFRVRGTEGLRVVDASVFPRIPGFFIVTSVYMLSEKASEDILEDAGNGGGREVAQSPESALRHVGRSVARGIRAAR